MPEPPISRDEQVALLTVTTSPYWNAGTSTAAGSGLAILFGVFVGQDTYLQAKFRLCHSDFPGGFFVVAGSLAFALGIVVHLGEAGIHCYSADISDVVFEDRKGLKNDLHHWSRLTYSETRAKARMVWPPYIDSRRARLVSSLRKCRGYILLQAVNCFGNLGNLGIRQTFLLDHISSRSLVHSFGTRLCRASQHSSGHQQQ
ncbi:hypothetical protein LX36DRAFT_649777 [Colletotrichum falcatum]|nr:hypothetical protein LX36DRAFT_649777 [Colletotrichum falcatum]